MGRNIPSISYRIDAKIREWERFASLLPPQDRLAFQKLIPMIKDRRTAIDAADEDISLAILLAITTHLKGELDVQNGKPQRKETQGRLD
jgi:hypothetical protein